MKGWIMNLLLLAVVVALAASAFVLSPESEFAGSDNQALKVIGELAPSYERWFAPFWEPPGPEMQSLLFAVQAALGAGIIGYAVGYLSARRRQAIDPSGTINLLAVGREK